MSVQTRLEAVKLAVSLLTKPKEIVEAAKIFDDYINTEPKRKK